MSNKLNILESKKLFKEFGYLMSDVEFKNEFIREYGHLFEGAMKTALYEEPILKQSCIDRFGDILSPKKQDEKPIDEHIEMSNSTDVVAFIGEKISEEPVIKLEPGNQKMKELYRKIVQKTHPDKVKSDALNEFYVKATSANKRGDIFAMYVICNELGIKFDVSDEEIIALKNHIHTIKTRQFNFERSHIWAWVYETNEGRKREIIRHFLINYAPHVSNLF
ncbi:MAG: hypothetical protein AABY15_05350 [Nanoarchaeota archaeon]